MLHVSLDCGVVEQATNQPLGVEDRVAGVDRDLERKIQAKPKSRFPHLALGGVSNQSLAVGKRNIGRCRSVSLIVCNDLHLSRRRLVNKEMKGLWFHLAMLKDTDTGIGGAEVDSDGSLLLSDHD